MLGRILLGHTFLCCFEPALPFLLQVVLGPAGVAELQLGAPPAVFAVALVAVSYLEAALLHKHPDTAEDTAPYATYLHQFLHTRLYNSFSSEDLHNDSTVLLLLFDYFLENLAFF